MTSTPLTLHVIRTQVGSGRLANVDAGAAADVAGVAAVLTHKDVPAGADIGGRPVLVAGEILFQGQELAAVVADDPYVAADAAEMVEVEVDVDPDPEGDPTVEGAIDSGSDAGVTCVVIRPRWHVAPLRTQQCVAEPLDDGTMALHATVRDAPAFIAALARATGIPSDRLSMVDSEQRGMTAPGPDLVSPGHALAVIAAEQLGRPVRWQETRADSMTSGGAQVGFTGIASVSDSPGPGARLDLRLTADVGAYPLPPLDESAWPDLDWYGFDASIEVRERRSHLPPAMTGGIQVLGGVFLADAAIDELSRVTGQSRSDVQASLLESHPVASELLHSVEARLDGSDTSGQPSFIGTALAPGLAAGVRVSLDQATGEWRVHGITLCSSFEIPTPTAHVLAAGALDGYGLSSMQEIPFDEQGNCLAATLMDYVMPTSWEAPPVDMACVSSDSAASVTPDLARLLATAAVAQAARNAASHQVTRLKDVPGPLSSFAVWEASRT